MPVWNKTINLGDVWTDPVLDFNEKVEKITERIKESGWRAITPHSHTFDELIARLDHATTVPEFDQIFSAVYDLADLDRVWIETDR